MSRKKVETMPQTTLDGLPETIEVLPEASEAPTMVKKMITCTRCNGLGTWVSSKTGVRRKTAGGPLADSKRKCPRCNGTKKSHVWITEEQDRLEKKERAEKKARAKAQVDAKAEVAKKEIDKGE